MEDGEEWIELMDSQGWRNACTPRCPHHPEEPATYFCCMLSWNEVEAHTGSSLFLLLHFRVPHWVFSSGTRTLRTVLRVWNGKFLALMLPLAVDISKSTHRWTSVNLNISRSQAHRFPNVETLHILHVGMLCGPVSQGATCECPCICADSWRQLDGVCFGLEFNF